MEAYKEYVQEEQQRAHRQAMGVGTIPGVGLNTGTTMRSGRNEMGAGR